MPPNALSPRDVNTSAPTLAPNSVSSNPPFGDDKNKKMVVLGMMGGGGGEDSNNSNNGNKPKSMEYHRQVLKERLDEEKSKQTYISPSDTIMSPCTAKLSAYKSKHFMKVKPQSLFAKTSAKNLAVVGGENKKKDGMTGTGTETETGSLAGEANGVVNNKNEEGVTHGDGEGKKVVAGEC